MEKIKHLGLKAKLFLSFGLIILVLILLGLGSIYLINQVNSANKRAIENWQNVNFISEKENDHLE